MAAGSTDGRANGDTKMTFADAPQSVLSLFAALFASALLVSAAIGPIGQLA